MRPPEPARRPPAAAGGQKPAAGPARAPACCAPPARCEAARHGEPLLKSVRQLIESVSDALKGQLDLEAHGGRTFEGAAIGATQPILTMAAAIWHDNKTGATRHQVAARDDH